MYSFPIGNEFPEKIPAFIEISKASNIKYEWDEENNILVLDRILHSSVMYPENYGFIPQTLCDDGDPLDVLVLSHWKLQPGIIVNVRPIGYMNMTDEKGRDEKLLAVIDKDPYYTDVKSLNDMRDHKLIEIKEFFKTYKNLEQNKWSQVEDWHNYDEAIQLLKTTHDKYNASKSV
jgi:inorganic pyrophosphatase